MGPDASHGACGLPFELANFQASLKQRRAHSGARFRSPEIHPQPPVRPVAWNAGFLRVR